MKGLTCWGKPGLTGNLPLWGTPLRPLLISLVVCHRCVCVTPPGVLLGQSSTDNSSTLQMFGFFFSPDACLISSLCSILHDRNQSYLLKHFNIKQLLQHIHKTYKIVSVDRQLKLKCSSNRQYNSKSYLSLRRRKNNIGSWWPTKRNCILWGTSIYIKYANNYSLFLE